MTTLPINVLGERLEDQLTLILKANQLPKLEMIENGVKRYKTVSWLQLLETLDKSITVSAVKENKRVTAIPALPPQTLFLKTVEYTDHTEYVVTGWVKSQTYPFYYQERGKEEGLMFTVPLPSIIYKVVWSQGKILKLSLAVTLENEVEKKSKLYRWPFSNVYDHAGVCWHGRIECPELSEVVEKGVFGFLQTPNNADLFGIGQSQNSSYSNYEEFLRVVETEGLKAEWLIPLTKNVEEFHHA